VGVVFIDPYVSDCTIVDSTGKTLRNPMVFVPVQAIVAEENSGYVGSREIVGRSIVAVDIKTLVLKFSQVVGLGSSVEGRGVLLNGLYE